MWNFMTLEEAKSVCKCRSEWKDFHDVGDRLISYIISLLISPLLGHRPSLWITHKKNGPSADWWVLTTANTAGTNGSACLPKHWRARNITFLVTHLKTDQCCLTSAIVRWAHWPRGHELLNLPLWETLCTYVIISLLMSLLLRHRPSLLTTTRAQSGLVGMYGQQYVTLYTCSSILALMPLK
jgi:hypothetical protein